MPALRWLRPAGLAAAVAAAAPAQPLLGDPVPPDPGDPAGLLTDPPGRRPAGGLFGIRLPPPPRPDDRDTDRAPQYLVRGYFDRPVRGQPATLSELRNEFYVPFPISIDDTDLLGGTFRLRNLHFKTNAVLPDSRLRFPSDLWDVRFGLAYLHRDPAGWSAGVVPRFGSASDQPFKSTRELYVGGTAFVRFPAAQDGDFWSLSLNYFPNGPLPYPIPGVVYEWNPSPDLRVGVGVPFTVVWKPAPDVRVDFNYTPLSLVTARVNWLPSDRLTVYGGFDWDNEGYFRAGRPNRRDLFYFDEKRLTGGARYDLTRRIAVDLSAGWTFDRRFGTGRSNLRLRSDRLTVDAGGFLQAWLLAFF